MADVDELVEQSEQPVEEDSKPAEASAEVDSRRKLAHYHAADRRASQTGPIPGSPPPVGRSRREPCYEVVHHVKNPGGFRINEIRYMGRVTVPECVANYLTYMDREWERVERDLFRDNRLDKTVGHVHG